ncbi:hypothetical protein WA026_021418 [Henosepilachna vigintioctopunctata]|uniref:FP protein C-terminal domain-containing protein n=1 Tax=Henosepilachna vigintioctopunctata TaxID=420089 RepID=A0AAW1TZ73_9CUCU
MFGVLQKLEVSHALFAFPVRVSKISLWKKKRARGTSTFRDMELDGEKRIIYINDDLPREIQDLLRSTKELRKTGFRYIWVKDGNVLCRKTEHSKTILITSTSQIEQLKK